jgi:hypothetical protein
VKDVVEDPSWRFALIVVTSNQERVAINRVQALRFAKTNGVPVVRWRLPLAGNSQKVDDNGLLEKLYN